MKDSNISLLFGYNYDKKTKEVKIIPFVIEGYSYSLPPYLKTGSKLSDYDMFKMHRLDKDEQFVYKPNGGTNKKAIEASICDDGVLCDVKDIEDNKIFNIEPLKQNSNAEQTIVQSYLNKFVPNSTCLTTYELKLELELTQSKLAEMIPFKSCLSGPYNDYFVFYVNQGKKQGNEQEIIEEKELIEFCKGAGEVITKSREKMFGNNEKTEEMPKGQKPLDYFFGDIES